MEQDNLEVLKQIYRLADVAMELVNQYAPHFDAAEVFSPSREGAFLGKGKDRNLRHALVTLSDLGWAQQVSKDPERWTLDWGKLGYTEEQHMALTEASHLLDGSEPCPWPKFVLRPVLGCKGCGAGVGELDRFCWQCGHTL